MPDMVQLVPITESATSSDAGGSNPRKSRKRTTSARKAVERVAHERAPGLATIVAGHHHRRSHRTSSFVTNGNGSKRYSSSEYKHLIPDQDGELHDPEYEAIKIVQRKPSLSSNSDDSGVSSSTEEEESSTTHSPYRNYHYQPPPLSNRRPINGYTSSNLATGRSVSLATRSSDYSSGAGTRRNYGGNGVTYLAPSITMPPVASSYAGSIAPSEQYNPFTYVPTTSRPSEAFSHSTLLPSHHRRHVDPSNAYTAPISSSAFTTARPYHIPEEVAPPIPWNSSFTPSADHSERHKTRIHDQSVAANCMNLKTKFQKVKLDVSFGLLKLKKKS